MKQLLLLVSIIIVSVVLVLGVHWNLAIRNAQSLQWTRAALLPNGLIYASLPKSHPRAAWWGAIQDGFRGDYVLAQSRLEPLTQRGDRYAWQLRAKLYEQADEPSAAINAWREAQDYVSLKRLAHDLKVFHSDDYVRLALAAAQQIDPIHGTLPLAEFLIREQGDITAGIEVLQTTIPAYPAANDWANWQYLLAEALIVQGRPAEAVEAYRLVLQRWPHDWKALIGLSWAGYEINHDVTGTKTQLEAASTYEKVPGATAMEIGKLAEKAGQPGEADRWFKSAIMLSPDYAPWYMTRALAARRSDNVVQAIEIYKTAISRFHEQAFAARAYEELAVAYSLNNQAAEAVDAIEQALALMPTLEARALIRAGQIYEFAGRRDSALNAYRLALKDQPSNSIALEGVKRLDTAP